MASAESGLIALSAGITMAGTGIATAWAEKVVGGATVGAMAEKPALFGRGLTLMALPESIVIFGLVIALQLIGKIT
jgi:V/A-type H+-transporting ATPase subunit K